MRRLADGAVVVDLRTSKIFELNETGARIWELLVEGLDAETVAQRLTEEFEVEAGIAAAEVQRVMTELSAADLVSL